VSRHHILPPIVYTPAPPKPKETRRRRGVLGASATDEAEETEGASEAATSAPPRKASPLPQHKTPVEPTERRVPSPNGKLSDGTLKAMLEVQEQDASQGVGASMTNPGK
jgi:hypothetical protein